MSASDSDLQKGEYREIRTQYILINGVMVGGIFGAIGPYSMRVHGLEKILIERAVYFLIFLALGYLWGMVAWKFTGRRVIEDRIAKEKGATKRVPMASEFHPVGLIIVSLIGVQIIAFHIYIMKCTLADYAVPAIVVCVIMLIQLLLDYRHTEEEYLIRTTSPSLGFTFGQLVRFKWPVFLLCFLMQPLGIVKVGGLFLACLIFSYPYQRRFYRRSQAEFGDHPQA